MSKENEMKNITADDRTIDDFSSQNFVLSSENNNKKNKKLSKALKVILLNNDTKFMSDFDPEQSNREKRKLTRKFTNDGKKESSVHHENIVTFKFDKNICDCLTDGCPGCHFPCPKCKSNKCALDCRVNRKWIYDEVEYEGSSKIIKNSKMTQV